MLQSTGSQRVGHMTDNNRVWKYREKQQTLGWPMEPLPLATAPLRGRLGSHLCPVKVRSVQLWFPDFCF